WFGAGTASNTPRRRSLNKLKSLIATPEFMARWTKAKAEPTPPLYTYAGAPSGHPWYQQIIFNTTWDRYADEGRWELLRGLIDRDPVWMRKSFEELRGGLSTNATKDN